MPVDVEAARRKCAAGSATISALDLQVELNAALDEIEHLRERPIVYSPPHEQPVPMRLACEGCGKLHIDDEPGNPVASKPHHTHVCQFCGLTWRPAIVPTVGVRFLPGFKNKLSSAHRWDDARCPRGARCVHEALCEGSLR